MTGHNGDAGQPLAQERRGLLFMRWVSVAMQEHDRQGLYPRVGDCGGGSLQSFSERGIRTRPEASILSSTSKHRCRGTKETGECARRL